MKTAAERLKVAFTDEMSDESCELNNDASDWMRLVWTDILTDSERKTLFNLNLTIRDICEGRYRLDVSSDVFAIMRTVNQRVGHKIFTVV